MSSSSTILSNPPFSLQITTDGCCLNNGTRSARAGWGAVIVLSNHVGHQVRAEMRSALCHECDAHNHTNNRAELRAADCALAFIHEVCKLGHSSRSCGYYFRRSSKSRRSNRIRNIVSDARPIDTDWVSAVIRSDSTFVIKGLKGENKPRKHFEVWESMNNCKRCLLNKGCHLQFHHVYGHSGDEQNERADVLARIAAAEAPNMMTATCLDCELEFDEYEELAAHFKSVHMERDLEDETDLADHAETTADGMFICPLCPKQLRNIYGVRCHLADKHGRP